ncbi:uncharacterized protein [Clytia hemisphaerica]|eukprot:TCONS_00049586-protein
MKDLYHNILYIAIIVVVMLDLACARASSNECSLSSEAKNKHLFKQFREIQTEYYTLQPYLIASNLEYDGSHVKMQYAPYLPTPENLERIANKSAHLLNKLEHWNGARSELKPREERLIHQFKYFLKSNFDSIYEGYYDGMWMLGPDYFCEQPICYALEYFHQALQRMLEIDGSILTLTDMRNMISLVKEHRKTFEQYLKNMKNGVNSGMVWSEEVCKASSKTFRKIYRDVRTKPEGILKMKFAKVLMNGIRTQKGLYKKLGGPELEQFRIDHGDYETQLNKTIIEYIGKPVHDLIKYMKDEHIQHCPPSSISSGLGSLPLKYVYKNGQIDGDATQKLPGTKTPINVTAGYKRLLAYYTSGNYTGDNAFEVGTKLADSYYKEVEELAMEITDIDNKKEAITELKKRLKSKDFIFNKEPFPESESDDEAHEKCDSEEDAKLNCPKRWKAFEAWKNNNTEILKEASSRIKNLFYTEGANKTTPDCKVQIVPDYDPTNGVPSYLESDPDCDEPAEYFLPFFKNKMGPSFDDYNTNFHEARPGHHLQIQGYLENFMDECEDISMWINNLVDYYPSFSEGWGLYSENPILLKDVNLLEDKLYPKYGALKWQIWRALRLVADVGFHQRGISRDEILKKFQKYTWDTSDTVEKELTRYQGTPGQATSYTLGQQTILKLRNYTRQQLGSKFDIREFHYALLSVGQAPFDYIKLHLENYVKCKNGNHKDFKFCDLVLNSDSGSRKRGYMINDPVKIKRQTLIKKFSRTTRKYKHL